MTRACTSPAPSYHNTTGIHDQALLNQYEGIAERQERIILKFAREHPTEEFFDQTVLHLFSRSTPVTSIRRAITRVKKSGQIKRTRMITGPYGRPAWLHQYVSTEELCAA